MGLSRRRLLGATAGAAAWAGLAACGTDEPDTPPSPTGSGVTFRWLGNNAWEVRFASTTLLIDPWLTRFRTGTYTPAGIDPGTPLSVDPAAIDAHIERADLILVGHGHYDHITDVPYIARRTGAKVLGAESHLNTLRAMDAPDGQLVAVRAGSKLEYGGYTVDVFHGLHSMSGTPPAVPFPGTRDSVPPRPKTVADLVEGGTLAYQVTIGGRLTFLSLSSGNFDEGALAGLRPDLAIVPAGGAPGYAARLLRTIDHPRWVLPTHWDDFDRPLAEPARDRGGLRALEAAVAQASPDARFVRLDHLERFSP